MRCRCSLSPRRPLYWRVVLRRLAAVEHAVVAHHLKYPEVLGGRIGEKFLTKGNTGIRRRNVDKVGENAGPVNALERIALPGRFNRQYMTSRFGSNGKGRLPPL